MHCKSCLSPGGYPPTGCTSCGFVKPQSCLLVVGPACFLQIIDKCCAGWLASFVACQLLAAVTKLQAISPAGNSEGGAGNLRVC